MSTDKKLEEALLKLKKVMLKKNIDPSNSIIDELLDKKDTQLKDSNIEIIDVNNDPDASRLEFTKNNIKTSKSHIERQTSLFDMSKASKIKEIKARKKEQLKGVNTNRVLLSMSVKLEENCENSVTAWDEATSNAYRDFTKQTPQLKDLCRIIMNCVMLEIYDYFGSTNKVKEKFYTPMTVSNVFITKLSFISNYIRESVRNHYNNNNNDVRKSPYVSIISNILGRELSDKIFDIVQRYIETAPEPDSETIERFNLTKYGSRIKSWDPDGIYRQSFNFPEYVQRSLDLLPLNLFNVKTMQIYLVKFEVLKLFSILSEIIIEKIVDDYDLNIFEPTRKSLLRMKNGRDYSFSNVEMRYFFTHIFIFARDFLNENLTGKVSNKFYEASEFIKQTFPEAASTYLNEVAQDYRNQLFTSRGGEIYKSVLDETQNNLTIFMNSLSICKDDLDYISETMNKAEKGRLNKAVNTPFDNVVAASLFRLAKSSKLNKNQKQILHGLILPENEYIFDKIVTSNKEVNPDIIREILELKYPYRKKIHLKKDKVIESKKSLARTIEVIDDFVGIIQDESVDNIQKSSESTVLAEISDTPNVLEVHDSTKISGQPKDSKYEFTSSVNALIKKENVSSEKVTTNIEVKNFDKNKEESDKDKKIVEKDDFSVLDSVLDYILNHGSIHKEKIEDITGESIRFINSWIDSFNERYFDIFDDSILVIDGDSITADEYYIEEAREYLNGKNKN